MSKTARISSREDPNYTRLFEHFLGDTLESVWENKKDLEIRFISQRFSLDKNLLKQLLFDLSQNPEYQKKQHDIYKEIFAKTTRTS